MTVHISEDEMIVLAYCHEHAEGFGERHPFYMRHVSGALGVDPAALRKQVSYLSDHGLLGVPAPVRTRGFLPPEEVAMAIFDARRGLDEPFWITGNGENFMRELEIKLEQELLEAGKARKITTKVVGIVMTIGKTVLEETVKAYVTTMVMPHKA